mgnify:CR=1 FL=1
MYRPRIQLIVDYILLVPMFLLMMVSIGVIKISKEGYDQFRMYFASKVTFTLMMYCFKPFIVTLLAKCFGYTNQSFYTKKLFGLRCAYDSFWILFPAFITYYDGHATDVQTIVIALPVVLEELLLYFISVKSGKEHSKKIIYRLLKIKVQTEEDNDAMYSTDDESGALFTSAEK